LAYRCAVAFAYSAAAVLAVATEPYHNGRNRTFSAAPRR
jgi:hypothetical protein